MLEKEAAPYIQKVAAMVVVDLQSTAALALEVKVRLDPTTSRASSSVGARRFPRKNRLFRGTHLSPPTILVVRVLD
jgi:hypothetical protein